MSSTVSLPYSVMIFLGVTLDLLIVVIFSPASIHPACLALSDNCLLNRLMDFDFLSKISGSCMVALLKRFIPVVDL